MRKIVSTSILSVGALAGLLGALLVSTEPAEARKMTCIAKYRLCNQRCASYGAKYDWTACILRTCEPQIKNCEGTALVGPKQAANNKQDPKAKAPYSPRVTGPFIPKAPKPPTGGFVSGKPTGGIGRIGRR